MIFKNNNSLYSDFLMLFGSRISGGMAVFFIIFFLTGCRTTLSVQSPEETREDAQGALSSVVGALSGELLSEEDLRNLKKQIRKDEEAQTAIQAMTETVGGKMPIVKYCPVTGRRYAPHMEYCPEHHIKLKIVTQ